MNITRESILGFGMDTSLVNLGWTRNDGKNIDSVEFEIKHKSIEKLERNINSKTEYIMCFVHFNADTEDLDGIYLSVWDDEDGIIDDQLDSNILNKEEKKVIIDYALEELRDCRE